MNNEFNNQNINQFQNNNMNNQYSNNYKDLNNQNNKKSNNGLTYALIFIIIVLAGLCLYLFMDKKDNDVDNNKDSNMHENGNDEESINLSESQITKYLDYVPYLNASLLNKFTKYNDAYSGDKINVNNIDNSMLLYNAIINSSEYVFKENEEIPLIKNHNTGAYGMQASAYYKESDIKEYLKRVYNINNINIKDEVAIPGGMIILQDGYYLKVMGAGSIGYDKNVYSTKHYLENDNLVIEENVLFSIYDLGEFKFSIYANTNDMHNNTNIVDTFTLDYTLADNISLKDYTDKAPTKYKHTYKKVNNEYVWYSTEIVGNSYTNNKVNYEIKTVGTNKELYVNNKKVNGVKANNELGSIEVKEFNNLLIVDEQNPGPSRKLFVVDKNGNATEIDYKVSTYNNEFINSIDSYKVEDNNLYIKVNRQWGNGYIDWYCRYEDKNEVAEYEVKYEYSNGTLGNRQVLNEVTIANKYKNEKCN